MSTQTKEGISINSKFEMRYIYMAQKPRVKYEILTFERYDGLVKSTAHEYKGEYKNRTYTGDIIKINSSHDVDFDSVRRLHNKAKSIMKKYHLINKRI